MIDARTFRRGDVVLSAIPFPTDPTSSKVRPSVVIQNDVGNRFSPNLIVAAISSQLPTRSYPTNFIVRRGSAAWAGTGLDEDSVIQTEVIFTVSKVNVTRRIGQFSVEAMQGIDQALRASLGLSR